MSQARQTRKLWKRLGAGALVIVLLAYPLDWCVWELRMLRGHGMGTVDLTETTAATLKGNHFEVYSQETTSVNCSRSLLPQSGAGACWWLRRHNSVVTQY